jgi:hypothetical protein
MRTLRLTLLCSVGLFVSATHPQVPPDEPAYSNRIDAAAWKRLVDRRVVEQAAGKKAPWGESWRDFWTAWYAGIREFSGLPWPGSEFDTREKMLNYVKRRLKERHLPTYE